jgi:hypothetical protein
MLFVFVLQSLQVRKLIMGSGLSLQDQSIASRRGTVSPSTLTVAFTLWEECNIQIGAIPTEFFFEKLRSQMKLI